MVCRLAGASCSFLVFWFLCALQFLCLSASAASAPLKRSGVSPGTSKCSFLIPKQWGNVGSGYFSMAFSRRYFACHADDGTTVVFETKGHLHDFIDELENRGGQKPNWTVAAVSSMDDALEFLSARHEGGKRRKLAAAPALSASVLETQRQSKVEIVIDVYTDGACIRNGQADAAAGIGVFFAEGCSLNASLCMPFAPATNQRAELAAVLCALVLCEKENSCERNLARETSLADMLKGHARPASYLLPYQMNIAIEKWLLRTFPSATKSSREITKKGFRKFIEENYWARLRVLEAHELAKEFINALEARVCIWTDSHYAAKCVTEWADQWEKNNWKASNGQKPVNTDLIKAIREFLKEKQSTCERVLWRGKCEFKYVAGHSGNKSNDSADSLANRGAKLLELAPHRKQELDKMVSSPFDFKEVILKMLDWKEHKVS